MSKVKIGVVEDEILIADNIIESLEELGYEVAGPAISYTAALELITKEKPDILLLDIILAGKKDGIDLAWKIKEEFNLPFIFLTSNADKNTIDRAKLVNPHAYLVKPFTKDELYSAIEIACYNFNENSNLNTDEKRLTNKISHFLLNNAIFVKEKGNFTKVNFDEILFIESDHIYLNIVTKSGRHLVRSSMSEYLEKFPETFLKIHRSYAVNLNMIKNIHLDKVIVEEYSLPLSKNYRDELLSKLNLG